MYKKKTDNLGTRRVTRLVAYPIPANFTAADTDTHPISHGARKEKILYITEESLSLDKIHQLVIPQLT